MALLSADVSDRIAIPSCEWAERIELGKFAIIVNALPAESLIDPTGGKYQ